MSCYDAESDDGVIVTFPQPGHTVEFLMTGVTMLFTVDCRVWIASEFAAMPFWAISATLSIFWLIICSLSGAAVSRAATLLSREY